LYAPGSTDVYIDTPAAASATDGNNEYIQGTVLASGYWYIDVYSYDGTTNYSFMATLANSTTSQTIEFNKNASEHPPR